MGGTHITPPSPHSHHTHQRYGKHKDDVDIPEGIRVAYGRAYIRLKENEGLKSQAYFLIDPYSLTTLYRYTLIYVLSLYYI